jgi:hypothetical protein
VSGPLALLYPVLAQVLLTLVLILAMGRARIAAVQAGRVRVRDVALAGDAWPEDVRKVANNAHNQFETPILFYVLCGAAIFVGATSVLMVLLAWAYVASRLVHSAIHVTTNRVRHRFIPFAIGMLVLIAMWLAIVLHLLAA